MRSNIKAPSSAVWLQSSISSLCEPNSKRRRRIIRRSLSLSFGNSFNISEALTEETYSAKSVLSVSNSPEKFLNDDAQSSSQRFHGPFGDPPNSENDWTQFTRIVEFDCIVVMRDRFVNRLGIVVARRPPGFFADLVDAIAEKAAPAEAASKIVEVFSDEKNDSNGQNRDDLHAT
jgi:hypothetical protein